MEISADWSHSAKLTRLPNQAAFVALRNDIRGVMQGKVPSSFTNEPVRGADYIPLEMVETRHET